MWWDEKVIFSVTNKIHKMFRKRSFLINFTPVCAIIILVISVNLLNGTNKDAIRVWQDSSVRYSSMDSSDNAHSMERTVKQPMHNEKFYAIQDYKSDMLANENIQSQVDVVEKMDYLDTSSDSRTKRAESNEITGELNANTETTTKAIIRVIGNESPDTLKSNDTGLQQDSPSPHGLSQEQSQEHVLVDESSRKTAQLSGESDQVILKDDGAVYDFPRCSFEERRKHLQQMCEARTQKQFDKIGHRILVDDVHKIIQCPISKVGSTSMKKFFAKIFDPTFDTVGYFDQNKYLSNFRELGSLSQEEQVRVMNEYFKFMIVRHPLDRLRSAWENKVETHNQLTNDRLKPVVDEFLKRAGKENITELDYQITFPDFLAILTEKGVSGFLDEHWKEYTTDCLPCYVQYDYIFHMESLDEDIKPLYDQVRQVRGSQTFEPFVNVNNARDGSAKDKMTNIPSMYKDIDQDIMDKVYEIYKDDFELFGYHWDKTLGGYCSMPSNGTHSCC